MHKGRTDSLSLHRLRGHICSSVDWFSFLGFVPLHKPELFQSALRYFEPRVCHRGAYFWLCYATIKRPVSHKYCACLYNCLRWYWCRVFAAFQKQHRLATLSSPVWFEGVWALENASTRPGSSSSTTSRATAETRWLILQPIPPKIGNYVVGRHSTETGKGFTSCLPRAWWWMSDLIKLFETFTVFLSSAIFFSIIILGRIRGEFEENSRRMDEKYKSSREQFGELRT